MDVLRGMSKIHHKTLNIAQPVRLIVREILESVVLRATLDVLSFLFVHVANTTYFPLHMRSVKTNILFQLLSVIRKTFLMRNKMKILLKSIVETLKRYYNTAKLYKYLSLCRCRGNDASALCSFTKDFSRCIRHVSERRDIPASLDSLLSFLLLHRSKFTQPSKLIRLWSRWIARLIRK